MLPFYLYKEFLQFLYIFKTGFNLEFRIQIDTDALRMMEVSDSLYIFRSYSTTQEEWNIAIVILQNLPIKLLTTSTHRLTFGVEKEVVNSAYVLLIFLDILG